MSRRGWGNLLGVGVSMLAVGRKQGQGGKVRLGCHCHSNLVGHDKCVVLWVRRAEPEWYIFRLPDGLAPTGTEARLLSSNETDPPVCHAL